MRTCAALPALAAISLPVAAQSSPANGPESYWGGVELVDSNSIDWPAGLGGPGPFERVVTGRLTDQDTISALVLKGGILTLVYHPTSFTALAEISPTSFSDVTVLAAPGEGETDVILAVNDDGLHRIAFDPEQRTFVQESIGAPLWQGAQTIRSAELDGQPGAELLGLDAEGTHFLVGYWNELELELEETFPIGNTASDVTSMDWDDDGVVELVALAHRSLEVFALDGRPIDDVRLLRPGGSMAVLRDPGSREQLAWVVRNQADTAYWHFAFNADSYQGPLPLLFSPPTGGSAQDIDLFSVSCGDWNGDGRQDVLLGHESFLQALILNNQGQPGAASFDLEEGGYARYNLNPVPSQTAQGNRGIPAFADLDRDPFRAADMVVPLDSHAGLVIKGSSYDRTTHHPVEGAPPPVWEFLDAQSYYAPGDVRSETDGSLALMLNDVPMWLLEKFSYVQVVVWKQADPLSNPDSRTQDVALDNFIHPVAQHDGSLWGYQRIDIPIRQPGLLWEDRTHYYVYLRFVDAAPDGDSWRILSSGYALTLGLTLPGELSEQTHTDPITNPAYAYLRDQGVPDVLIPLSDDPPPGVPAPGGGGSSNNSPGNLSVGAIVPQPVLPPHDLPYIPNPTGPQTGASTLIWIP